MHEWIDQLRDLRATGERAVVVTVARVRGSAPRETGAKMLVTANDTLGTIGGGQLEYQCTRMAWELLQKDDSNEAMRRRFPLGSNCGQCCGGVVDVLFEECTPASAWFNDALRFFDAGQPVLMITRFADGGDIRKTTISGDQLDELDAEVVAAAQETLLDGGAQFLKLGATNQMLIEPVIAAGFNIAVFGAGHVGTATVSMLATLDCDIRWIDSRRNVFPEQLPADVQTIRNDSPEREVAAMPDGAFFLVMTHSHALDYDICCNVLKRDDLAYCGLIGSQSKQRRFTTRMRRDEIGNVEMLTCPIGVSGINGKKPAEIAISVAAELLQVRDAARQQAGVSRDGNVFRIEGRK